MYAARFMLQPKRLAAINLRSIRDQLFNNLNRVQRRAFE